MPARLNIFSIYTNAFSGLAVNSWYLSLVMLINRSGTMVIPFMTIYCTQQLHFSITQAGYIMGLFGAGSLAGSLLGGKLTDRLGFYLTQVGALLTGGLLFVLLGYQKSFTSLGVGIFILSVCNEAFRPANAAAIAHYSTPQTLTRSYSLNRLAINLGWAVGGFIGGLLASVNYQLLFWVDGCTNLLAAAILCIILPFSGASVTKIKKASSAAAISAYRDLPYLLFIGLTVLYATCFFQMFTLQPEFFKSRWHLGERFIGLLMGINGLFITLMEMPLVYFFEGRRHPLIYVAAGTFIIAAAFTLQSVLPPSAWVALLSILLLSVGEIISMPFMNAFWVARTQPGNRGQYAALYSMGWSLAPVLAPAIGSQIVLHAGFTSLWWLIGVIGCCTALGYTSLYVGLRRSVSYANNPDPAD